MTSSAVTSQYVGDMELLAAPNMAASFVGVRSKLSGGGSGRLGLRALCLGPNLPPIHLSGDSELEADKPSKIAWGPKFQSLRGIFRGVFFVSQEGFGGVFNFPRLFEEYC